MNNYHRALEVAFADFDKAAEYFKNHKQTVYLGGTKKDVFIVPVILVFLCDHKSNQRNTARTGSKRGICVIQV